MTMSDKIARLGIERDNDMMYYIKNGDVWATPRKQKGQPKGKAQKVAATGLEMDYSRYIYYLDGDGDVARKERSLGGGKRAKAPKAMKASAKAAPAASARGSKKSKAQLERDIAECLSRVKKENGNGNGNVTPAKKIARGGKKKAVR
jgi:predicted transcriptional regulator